jgi:RNA 2',3'-cyclic 3'-phosphodiesterase
MSRHRLFLGFAPDAGQRRQLQQLQKRLLQALLLDNKGREMAPPRPVEAANMHLTLAFLGGVDAAALSRLKEEIAAMAKPAFEVTLDRVQLWRGPRIFCLLGTVTDEALLSLARDAQSLAGRLGLHASEHEFSPHITLVRKARLDLPPVDGAPQSMASRLTLRPRELHLYESVSTAEGVQYRILASWPLDVRY